MQHCLLQNLDSSSQGLLWQKKHWGWVVRVVKVRFDMGEEEGGFCLTRFKFASL